MSDTYGREGVTSQEARVIALLPISLPASYSHGLQGKEFKMEIKGTARQGQPDCYTLAAQQSKSGQDDVVSISMERQGQM